MSVSCHGPMILFRHRIKKLINQKEIGVIIMNNKNKIRTKKCMQAVLAAMLAVGMLTGCGKEEPNKSAVEEQVQEAAKDSAQQEASADENKNKENEEPEAPEEAEEETEENTVTTPFLDDLEKYDSIISELTTEQYYAFAEIGEDYDALLVADGVYDNGDGNMAAIDAKVYGFGNDGNLYEAGVVWSDGTAYPLAVYDGHIMFGGNHHMTMAHVVDGSIVIVKEASEEFDEQGNATYSYNEGNIDDIREVEDDSILKEMYDTYAKATVLNFFQGEAEAIGDMGAFDYPSNGFEERVGKTTFTSYDEIIDLLAGDEAYALVDVKGYDGKVLLVADYTYDDLLGHIATIECTPYTVKANGECTADSLIVSGGTATPIALDSDGVICTATHSSVEKYCYGDNGTDSRSVMMLAAVSTDEFDDNGNPKTVSGFVRTKNSLIDDDNVFLEGNEVDILEDLFKEYEKAEPISFTKVEQ